MDGAFKYFFGGAGQGSIPGIILKKATFSSVMQKWEKEVFLRLLGLPINITGKLARTYTKEKTGQ